MNIEPKLTATQQEWEKWRDSQKDKVQTIIQNLNLKMQTVKHFWNNLYTDLALAPEPPLFLLEKRIEPHHDNLKVTRELQEAVIELTEILSLLKLHFTISLPKKEDNLATCQETCQTLLAKISGCSDGVKLVAVALGIYSQRRGHVAKQVIKHQSVHDYTQAIREMDVSTQLSIARWMVDMEHLQVILFDIFEKNRTDLVAMHIIHDPTKLRASEDKYNYFK